MPCNRPYLSAPVAPAERTRTACPRGALENALRCAGIKSFDSARVEAYKKQAIQKLQLPVPSIVSCRSSYIPGCAVGFLGIIMSTLWVAADPSGWACVMLTLSFIGAARSSYGSKASRQELVNMHPDAEWCICTAEEFLSYGESIPLEGLQQIEEMRLRCPDAIAYVHWLFKDPFLEFRRHSTSEPAADAIPAERFYTYVWNAPDFTG